ncbi:YbaB/EbfC family nucleoid-associated protein [Actinoplanes teichomyceticus]|uniref:YbaB/EbfC DNA-binding family protein n=1 Tax=Actinoplanes teichomyceticus TaxID=1867 RepID=A0A561WIE0_ACTTI|nr:YbaB/EbfC family nucleoid-associated protein [Actinoplanes teichomyceticus]TWG23631.1 YbaB/EbfC DNA-binding family protein [Actinoplanes teichomyceticus]GIF11670.1 hypothetical protein Ate01nite_17020 [Actinoplanes teichomyceticus]
MRREAPADWLARTVRDTMSRIDRINEARDRIAEISGAAESPGGEVRVVVTPAGLVRSLELSRTAYRLSPEVLADLIVETIRRAAADGASALTETLQPVAGADVDLQSRLQGYAGADEQTLNGARESLRAISREVLDRPAGGAAR